MLRDESNNAVLAQATELIALTALVLSHLTVLFPLLFFHILSSLTHLLVS